MRMHRGTTETTLRNYSPIVSDLLTTLGERPQQLEAKGLRAFVLERARRHGKAAAKKVVTATRMFVRFLIVTERCAPGLDGAIPSIAMWRLATLPQYLLADDLEHVVTACDPLTPLGARRETRLPLPQEVGDALLHYLAEARPPIHADTIFLTIMAPWKPISRHVVSQTAARAIHRADITAPTAGARVFRHSAATAMLRQGASLQTIGDILRHTSIETTAHYAKVDTRLLGHVVKPWPEDMSC
jgi:site-specific recombinase XerD